MSAPNPGRQSPEPERQSHAQVGKSAEGRAQDLSGGTQQSSKEKSQKQQENTLESNPKETLSEDVKAKFDGGLREL